jgi:hypothetical protein
MHIFESHNVNWFNISNKIIKNILLKLFQIDLALFTSACLSGDWILLILDENFD